MAKSVTLESPVKIITSGKVPTSTNLPNGSIAVGTITADGKNEKSIYANINGSISDLLSQVKTDIVSVQSKATANESEITKLKTTVNGHSNTLDGVISDLQTLQEMLGDDSRFATLGSDGKVPASQLPSYVDDVVEYSAKANFPATGETGKIYVDLSTNKTYRWGGSAYVEISASLAIGRTAGTAFDGAAGKAVEDAVKTLQNANKSNLVELTSVSINPAFAGGGIQLDFKTKNANGDYTICSLTLPDATASADGIFTKENYQVLAALASDAITSIVFQTETI